MPNESAAADLDNLKPIFFEGLNERIVPESIPLGDLSKLIGLRQNRLGELVRYPGETRINLAGLSSIRGLTIFGEYIIIQSAETLVRARLNELFPTFPQVTPELFPDNYSAPGGASPLNPEEMSYALIQYQKANNFDGDAVIAATWNLVPFNIEVADSDGRVSLSGGTITITAGSYPAFVRIDGEVCVHGPSSVAQSANSNQRAALRLRQISGGAATKAVGTAVRVTTANQAANGRPTETAKIKGRFSLAASTDFELQLYTSLASLFGQALNSGEVEVYGSLEILIEE